MPIWCEKRASNFVTIESRFFDISLVQTGPNKKKRL